MKRYATYRRVSEVTASNIEGSMNDQRDKCQAYIRQSDGILIRDYEELGKSAYNEKNLDKRTAYQQMLADAKTGLFDVVLVYKYDRFSRRTRIALQARYELEQAGVEVQSVSEPFDTRTAAGRFGVRTMLSVAELYSDQLSERLIMARASEAARGRHVGPPPVGYCTSPQVKGQLVRSTPYDALVHYACTLYAPGQLSPGRIAAAVNDAGYTMPNGRSLIAQDIRRIMQNAQIYAGYVRSAGGWIKGNHEPIIDDDLCARVLATFGRRSVEQDRRFVRTQDTTALLPGVIYCDQCRQAGHEAKMHYLADKRKNPPYRRYRCKTAIDGGPCHMSSLADAVEQQVLNTMDALSLALDGEWLQEAIELAEAQLAAPAPVVISIDPARIQEKIRRLGALYLDGVKTEAEYQTELAALRARLASAPVQMPQRPPISLQDVAERLLDLPTLMSAATVGERRAVLAECIDQVYANRDTVAAIRPTALFEPLLIAARGRVMDAGYRSTDSNDARLEIPLLLPARSEVH